MSRKKQIAAAAQTGQRSDRNPDQQARAPDREYRSLRDQPTLSPGPVAEPGSLVLEHLRAVRADLADHGQRLGRIEMRLSVIEQTLGSLYAIGGSDRETMQVLARRIERIERIERRLELTE